MVFLSVTDRCQHYKKIKLYLLLAESKHKRLTLLLPSPVLSDRLSSLLSLKVSCSCWMDFRVASGKNIPVCGIIKILLVSSLCDTNKRKRIYKYLLSSYRQVAVPFKYRKQPSGYWKYLFQNCVKYYDFYDDN